MRSLCIFVFLAASVAASAVHDLTSGDLNAFVEGHELSLVAFIAPWCIYCQDLEPEFESAAARVLDQGWPLARVDCEEEKDLCAEYRVKIYPTIRVFHGKEHSIYNGDRKADAMVSFLKRHSQPLVTTLSSTQDVVDFRTKENVTVVAYFDEDDHVSRAVFSDIAKVYRDKYLFGSISDDAFSLVEDVKKPSIVLYKTFDEGKNLFTEDIDVEKIKEFIANGVTPIVREIGVDFRSFPVNFGGNPAAIVFAETKEERAQLAAELRPVAEATRSQMVWVTADPIEYAQRASQAGLKPGAWPAFAIEDRPNDFKFSFSRRGDIRDLSANAIREVVDDFLAGRLKSTTVSDPVPASQQGPVTVVVADSYEEVVMNNDKDVILLYYSPTCKHCKAMAPSYNDFGELLKPYSDRITVAKIDATSNDVWPRVSSYPTIKLFRSSSKHEPITYEGNRTVGDFVKFAKNNGSQGVAEILGNLPGDLTSEPLHDEL